MFVLRNLLVCLFFSGFVISATIQNQQTKENSISLLTQIVFRHGDRAPVHIFPTQKQIQEQANTLTFDGQLTQLGSEQHKAFGKFLKHRYIDNTSQYKIRGIKSEYDLNQVQVYSTDQNRTISSAEALLSELFPNPKVPPPVHSLPIDNPLLMPYVDCPLRDVQASLNLFEVDHLMLKVKGFGKELQKVAKQGGFDARARPCQLLSQIFGNLRCYKAHNILNTSIEIIKKATGIVLDFDKYKYWKKRCEISELFDLNTTRKLGLDILDRISQNMRNLVLQSHSKSLSNEILDTQKIKMVLYSGHDSTLVPIFNYLGLLSNSNELVLPPYATSIVFDLKLIQTYDEKSKSSNRNLRLDLYIGRVTTQGQQLSYEFEELKCNHEELSSTKTKSIKSNSNKIQCKKLNDFVHMTLVNKTLRNNICCSSNIPKNTTKKFNFVKLIDYCSKIKFDYDETVRDTPLSTNSSKLDQESSQINSSILNPLLCFQYRRICPRKICGSGKFYSPVLSKCISLPDERACYNLARNRLLRVFAIILVVLFLLLIGLFWYLTVTFRRKWLAQHKNSVQGTSSKKSKSYKARQPLLDDGSPTRNSSTVEIDIEDYNGESCCLDDFRVDGKQNDNGASRQEYWKFFI